MYREILTVILVAWGASWTCAQDTTAEQKARDKETIKKNLANPEFRLMEYTRPDEKTVTTHCRLIGVNGQSVYVEQLGGTKISFLFKNFSKIDQAWIVAEMRRRARADQPASAT